MVQVRRILVLDAEDLVLTISFHQWTELVCCIPRDFRRMGFGS
jgi:hypothetical protein